MDEQISQYEQSREDWRHFNDSIWQLPSIAVAIASGILALSYEYVKTPGPRSVILFFGFLICLAFVIALIKHRLFMNERTRNITIIENSWSQGPQVKIIDRVKIKTDDIADTEKSWYHRISAYCCLVFIVFLTSIILLALSAYNLNLYCK